ncbi:hypothetical protein L798_07918 [Zootermopsis nevadensis]|uniref:Uncharacterized protein n=1 Tax=Zootermopsis nevadensis TaxID=136037 RepID=A0A067RJD5_ZOONE|nr:hypothetical protein L798_07918 [Zootermopsis nevadensis]
MMLSGSGYETPPNNDFVRKYRNCQRDDNSASTSRENMWNRPKCNLGATTIKDHIIQVSLNHLYTPLVYGDMWKGSEGNMGEMRAGNKGVKELKEERWRRMMIRQTNKMERETSIWEVGEISTKK